MIDEIVDRRGHARFPAHADQRAGLGFQLGESLFHDIPLHGGGAAVFDAVQDGYGPGHDIVRKADAQGGGHLVNLLHGRLQEPPGTRLAADDADRRAGHAADPAPRSDEDVLAPHGGLDVRRRVDDETPGVFECPAQPVDPFAAAVVPFPEIDEGFVGDVPDEARFRDERDDTADAAEHVPPAELRGELLRRLHPVLHGQDASVRPEQRPESVKRLGHLPALDAKHDDVHIAGLTRIADGLDGGQREIALCALHAKAVPLKSFQVRAARDEDDLFPRLGKPSSIVAAYPACTEYRYAHMCLR